MNGLRALLTGTLVATTLGGACASDDMGTDGETHFLCQTDPDCPGDQVCVDRQCVSAEPPGDVDAGGPIVDSPLADLLQGRHDYYLPDPANAMNLRLEDGTFLYEVAMCDAFGEASGPVAMTPDGTLRLTSPDSLTWPVAAEDGSYIHRDVDEVRITAMSDAGVTLLVAGTVQEWATGGNCAICTGDWHVERCDDAFAGSVAAPLDAGPMSPSPVDAGRTGAKACIRGEVPLQIAATSFVGQYLGLDLSYEGGCAEHTIDVWWSGAVAMSLPPLIALELHHHDGGDDCADLVTERVYVDMSELDDLAIPGDAIAGSVRVDLFGAWQSTGTLTPELRYEVPVSPVPPPAGGPVVGIELECGGILP